MKRTRQNRRNQYLGLLLVALALLIVATPVLAQGRELVITDVDISSAPTIEFTLLGRDSAGGAIDFNGVDLTVRHDGVVVPAEAVEIIPDGVSTGTLTLFLLDVPTGVSDSFPEIQGVVTGFAVPEYMLEPVDYVGVFQVGSAASSTLLGPENFNNSVINLFANPLTAETGRTALYDSIGNLLNALGSLKPDPDIATSFVIMSDGTDAVSSSFTPEQIITLANSLGVSLHTVWLENENIVDDDEVVSGQSFLQNIATQTGGVGTDLGDSALITAMYNQIASRRSQTLVRYSVDAVAGGDHTVEVSMALDPNARATATFQIPPEAPTVVLNIPPESRTLQLADINTPVTLSLSTSVSWVDGVDRELTRAELIVNGLQVQTIDPTTVANFQATINNFVYGDNSVRISVTDSAGNVATSGEVILTINQGETVIPETLQEPSGFSTFFQNLGSYWVWLLGCLGTTVMVIIVFALMWFLRNSSIFRALGLSSILSRIPFLRPYMSTVRQLDRYGRQAKRAKDAFSRYDEGARGSSDQPGGRGGARMNAFLEVVESQTSKPSRIDLNDVENRLGRSPKQANVSFDDDITMSRIHATIVQEGSDYRIFDEGSTSGTFVNEQRVPDYGIQLIDRDEIRMGAVILRFRQP
ncbi:MAG: FHA domain-containing protein [Anaerolineales bacterium]|nr:FHA domain-containing protein [Anaerolineales bacterium]MCB0007526.1 FHA domain-containing protein [Anaerolineales bacterium]MCB0018339.1 FHA domain-containing protein [Anaerolineales bacterium]MCB8962068.1 FHA domain-containing protein [Ardenticatenales bacterium]